MGKALGYRDAVTLLGGDPPTVVVLDRVLGGTLSVATGGLSDAVLSVFDAQGRVLRRSRDLITGLRGRMRGTARVDRTRYLEAAHAVTVVTAYFDALDAADLPFAVRDLDLTTADQLRLAGQPETAGHPLEALLGVAPPQPAPHALFERYLPALEQWYGQLSTRVSSFLRGLAIWDGLSDTARGTTDRILGDVVPGDAVIRFQRLHARLVSEVPEFGLWCTRSENHATRAEVRFALASMESLLASLSSLHAPSDISDALSRAYRATLHRPILSDGSAPGVCLPTLEEGYIDPDFRVRAVTGGSRPASEDWWAEAEARCDLCEYLAGVVTSPAATEAPIIVLGQPGAGKSVLTKVLAARLPAEDFVPVRVPLREVPAEAEIQDQIEYAIRATTGEHLQWSQLTRSTHGALPVVILDGFDELLQATGVSQSDYLVKVARFQQREADQGRPVVVLVTSRTAVADRSRYPDGAVALRLEPFRPAQITEWLTRWNRSNEEQLRARGLAPLTAEALAHHATLASQPLLLLMLALYDAEANRLQRGTGHEAGQPLDEVTLYEQLLSAFALREVRKSGVPLTPDEEERAIESELQRLSLVALGMTNRRRQWISESELETDLAAIVGQRTATPRTFRTPLTQADLTLGRFFFVQRARAIRDGAHLRTYEFLHATFGEYLVARIAVQLAAGLLVQPRALAIGSGHLDDDLLYALLSFAPLSSRQVLRFVRGRASRQVAVSDHHRLGLLLIDVWNTSGTRTDHRYADYRPATADVSSRHGIYSANILLLLLVFAQDVTAARLFPDVLDPGPKWHRRAMLWRSAMNEQEWTDLALALTVHYCWNDRSRDLDIRLNTEQRRAPEDVDPYWQFGIRPDDERRGNSVWRRHYADDLNHKMDMSGGTNDSVIRHAVEPVFRMAGHTLLTFSAQGDGPAASVIHLLVDLWLTGALRPGEDDLATVYRRCTRLLGALPAGDRDAADVARIVLHQLRSDAARLPATVGAECLAAMVRLGGGPAQHDARSLRLTVEAALAVAARQPSVEGRATLVRLVADTLAALRRVGTPADLEAVRAAIRVHPEVSAAVQF